MNLSNTSASGQQPRNRLLFPSAKRPSDDILSAIAMRAAGSDDIKCLVMPNVHIEGDTPAGIAYMVPSTQPVGPLLSGIADKSGGIASYVIETPLDDTKIAEVQKRVQNLADANRRTEYGHIRLSSGGPLYDWGSHKCFIQVERLAKSSKGATRAMLIVRSAPTAISARLSELVDGEGATVGSVFQEFANALTQANKMRDTFATGLAQALSVKITTSVDRNDRSPVPKSVGQPGTSMSLNTITRMRQSRGAPERYVVAVECHDRQFVTGGLRWSAGPARESFFTRETFGNATGGDEWAIPTAPFITGQDRPISDEDMRYIHWSGLVPEHPEVLGGPLYDGEISQPEGQIRYLTGNPSARVVVYRPVCIIYSGRDIMTTDTGELVKLARRRSEKQIELPVSHQFVRLKLLPAYAKALEAGADIPALSSVFRHHAAGASTLALDTETVERILDVSD